MPLVTFGLQFADISLLLHVGPPREAHRDAWTLLMDPHSSGVPIILQVLQLLPQGVGKSLAGLSSSNLFYV